MIMRKADRIVARISKGCGYVSCAALVFIMALVTADVTNRFITNSSIKGSYEMVRWQ
jgi:TRAP-type C4-dicarboxylate transport system permease small subunit